MNRMVFYLLFCLPGLLCGQTAETSVTNVQTIVIKKQIAAFDPSDSSKQLGFFQPDTTLKVITGDSATKFLEVQFEPPNGQSVRALCRIEDLQEYLPTPKKPDDKPSPGTKIQKGGCMRTFEGRLPRIPHKNDQVGYDFDLKNEKFYVFIPESYDGTTPYGVMGFINAGETMELPAGWDAVMDNKKLLYIAPQEVGNSKLVSRRIGLTLTGMLKMAECYRVDTRRMYVTGLSGGARSATRLAFCHPDLITGVAPICGADFFERVPRVEATNKDEYFLGEMQNAPIAKLKRGVRFALITGETDFRRGNIRDIYNGGFAKGGYQAKLFDIPGMGHTICSVEVITEAVEFLDSVPPSNK